MQRRQGLLDRFGRDRKGGVAIIGAGAMLLFVVLAALAIDLGSIVFKAREVQGTADLSALTAARNLTNAQNAALATARANLGNAITVTTVTGTYTPNRNVQPGQRFVPAASNPNAAKVTIKDEADLYFARIFGVTHAPVTRTATAALPGSTPSGMFSIGSRLLSLNRGLLNALLSALLGSNVQLDVMDYEKLVDTDINLLKFMDALAVELDVDAGDYDALLKHDVTTGEILKVLEVVADDDADRILGSLTGTRLQIPIKVGNLLGVDANAKDGLRRALNLDVSALDLVMASLETANANRQLQLNTGANLGIINSSVTLAIGERPNESAWVTVSAGGTPIIRTAQTRVHIKAKTGEIISKLLSVDLQLFAEVAEAEAKITKVTCSANNSVTVEARTGTLKLILGNVKNPQDMNKFTVPIQTEKLTIAQIILLVLPVPVDAYAKVESKDTQWQALEFSQSDIDQRKPKTVKSKQIVGSLVNNIFKELELSVVGISLSLLGDILAGLLTPVGTLVDLILNPLLGALGIGIGEADVTVMGVTCNGNGGIPYLVG